MQVFRNENSFITQSFIVMYILSGNYSIVRIGVSPLPPPQKHHPLILAKPPRHPLKSANCAIPPFLGNPLPLY